MDQNQAEPAPLWGAHDVALEYGWSIRRAWAKLRAARDRKGLEIKGQDSLTGGWLYDPDQAKAALSALGYSPLIRG